MGKNNTDGELPALLKSGISIHFSKAKKQFYFWLIMYSLFFVAGQYISVIPVNLSWLLGRGWWVPLHVITVIPLVDISRSFAQHYSEQAGMRFSRTFYTITGFSLFMSLIFTAIAGLPANICLAAFLSVNIGGIAGIILFNWVKLFSHKPYIRMLVSNLGATMAGGGVFFAIAYTKALPEFLAWFGYIFINEHIRDDLLKGWIVQSIFIWLASIPLAILINYMTDYFENS